MERNDEMKTDGLNRTFLLVALLLSLLYTTTLYAGENRPDTVSWGFLFIGLLGGLSFFLYGMEKMSDGLKKSAGHKMRSVLAALTKNRLIALVVGVFVTVVIQSSSATTVMLVSFVQAELMSFAQSLGVILGADIGTTVTAQLIASKVTDYALLMVFAGFMMRMLAKSENVKHIGEVVLGFGILFFGMKLMSDAMKPLRSYPGFIGLLKELENPIFGLLIGTAFTALIQSSAALIGIIIVLAQQGFITLDAGIPLVFGANIGTCVTAGLSCIGTSREAKRVALAHVLFKVVGVILFIFWIPAFADLIRAIAGRFGSGAARQIANAHTVFNVSLGLIFLPFTTLFAALIQKILPSKEEAGKLKPATWYLDESMISTPDFAIGLARTEISRMAKILGRMLRAIIIPFVSDERQIRKEGLSKTETELLLSEIPKTDEFFSELTLIEGIDMREAKIDFLDEKIGQYLIQVARQELTDEQACEVMGMISISNDMESIGDIIHRNLRPLIEKKRELEFDFSEEGKEELMIYHSKVCKQISRLKEAFAEKELKTARKIMGKETKYLEIEEKYRLKHLERIRQKRRQSIETHEVHTELLDLLKRINSYTGSIAKTFSNTCGQNSVHP